MTIYCTASTLTESTLALRINQCYQSKSYNQLALKINLIRRCLAAGSVAVWQHITLLAAIKRRQCFLQRYAFSISISQKYRKIDSRQAALNV